MEGATIKQAEMKEKKETSEHQKNKKTSRNQ